MQAKELILEILRETNFVSETFGAQIKEEKVQQSIAAINKACSAFLNGQEVEPRVDQFVRKEMEEEVYEEMELWGKFAPPPEFVSDSDKQ